MCEADPRRRRERCERCGGLKLSLGRGVVALEEVQLGQCRVSLDRLGVLLDRRWKEAQAEADYVLARDPRNLEALLLVADAAATAEEVESAVQRLEATRTALGDPPRLRVALANLHVR